MRKVKGRAVFGAAVGLVGLVLAQGAHALTVTYEWVPGSNSPTPGGGVGTITLDSAAITDAANFSGIAANALVSFSYAWNNGATFNSSSPFSQSVSAPGWSASGGFLTTVFQLAKTVADGSFSLAGQPYNPVFPTHGNSSNNVNSVTFLPPEIDAGNWRLASAVNPVPLPAGVWLLASGIAGLVGLRRRRAAV
jgi:hypothetical protein